MLTTLGFLCPALPPSNPSRAVTTRHAASRPVTGRQLAVSGASWPCRLAPRRAGRPLSVLCPLNDSGVLEWFCTGRQAAASP